MKLQQLFESRGLVEFKSGEFDIKLTVDSAKPPDVTSILLSINNGEPILERFDKNDKPKCGYVAPEYLQLVANSIQKRIMDIPIDATIKDGKTTINNRFTGNQFIREHRSIATKVISAYTICTRYMMNDNSSPRQALISAMDELIDNELDEYLDN